MKPRHKKSKEGRPKKEVETTKQLIKRLGLDNVCREVEKMGYVIKEKK